PYVVDFVCRERRLIVEVDGGRHATDPRDAARDIWLSERRYRVLRFWNNDVLANTEGVLEAIAAALSDIADAQNSGGGRVAPRPDPLPLKGERERTRRAKETCSRRSWTCTSPRSRPCCATARRNSRPRRGRRWRAAGVG